MARFTRGEESTSVFREGLAVVERTPHALGRRALHDERAALIAYYRRIAELISDRWIRTSEFLDDIELPDEPDLVAAIDAGDREALGVYTDWLLERGDPRGELAVLMAAPTRDEPRISTLTQTRGVEIFGPLATLAQPWRDQFTYVWRDGWIDEVLFHHAESSYPMPADREIMQHALHAPMARFARWLQLDDWYVTPIWECLGDCTCLHNIRGVRHVAVTNVFKEMLDRLPALEELEAQRTSIVTGGHPRVHRMSLTVDEDRVEVRGEWPALKTIELVCKRNVTQDEMEGLARLGAEITRRPA